ncbi:MAG: hypothetical protein E7452_09360 [Ruminococcaceae bacterium]|nr:hypothetical protein [Oscillospiraceae bacterium]
MENSVLGQLSAFACALCWGGCVGAIYELFGLLRVFGRRTLTALADLLFWLFASVATFLFLLRQNGGATDGYLLVAIVGGAVLMHLFSAKLTARTAKWARERILRRRRRRKVHSARKKRQKK